MSIRQVLIWQECDKVLPPKDSNRIVITYTLYRLNQMRYRIVRASDLRKLTDAVLWAYLPDSLSKVNETKGVLTRRVY